MDPEGANYSAFPSFPSFPSFPPSPVILLQNLTKSFGT
jgi:hypothetical protein